MLLHEGRGYVPYFQAAGAKTIAHSGSLSNRSRAQPRVPSSFRLQSSTRLLGTEIFLGLRPKKHHLTIRHHPTSIIERKVARLRTLTGAFIILVPLALTAGAQQKGPLKTQKDKVSYSIGLNIGKNFKQQLMDVDLNLLMQGIKDGLTDSKALLSDNDMREVMTTFQKEQMAKMSENAKKVGEKNKKEGEAFLAENKKKPGVKTLASGLQYKILKEGTGSTPRATDTVVTHYRGTLIDGKEFDSSYPRGEPVTFLVKGVIPGWTEALQLMKVGSKWQLFVPPQLAYRENGAGADIGPNATLIFEVELIGVK
jgi:FKBP-type peptidyl-prolyl cis-trans isomerase